MKRVLLVQPTLSHYRKSLFNLLTTDSNIQFKIIAGSEINGIEVFKSESTKIQTSLKNIRVQIKGHTFFFQKGIFKEIIDYKPTNIILGGPDFHFISTLAVSFYIIFFTQIKLHFWTHGLSKNNAKLRLKITKYLYKKAASILTYEEEGREGIIFKVGVDKNKITVVKNCLNDWDYGFNLPKKASNIDTSKMNILFSGRLTKLKRVDLLIEAIGILVSKEVAVSCTIIGDGEYKTVLENLTATLSLNEYIKFTGAIYDKSIQNYFRQSNLFVLPGKVGLSIVHALSFGLPIVTTSLPIHSPEAAILRHGQNAFFFEGQSPESLAKTLMLCRKEILNEDSGLSDNCIRSVKDNGYTPKGVKANFFKAILSY